LYNFLRQETVGYVCIVCGFADGSVLNVLVFVFFRYYFNTNCCSL